MKALIIIVLIVVNAQLATSACSMLAARLQNNAWHNAMHRVEDEQRASFKGMAQ